MEQVLTLTKWEIAPLNSESEPFFKGAAVNHTAVTLHSLPKSGVDELIFRHHSQMLEAIKDQTDSCFNKC